MNRHGFSVTGRDICAQNTRISERYDFMAQNILFVFLCAVAVAATVFIWWFENHNDKTDHKNGNEGNEL